jgi:hypothetical protein
MVMHDKFSKEARCSDTLHNGYTRLLALLLVCDSKDLHIPIASYECYGIQESVDGFSQQKKKTVEEETLLTLSVGSLSSN